MDDVININGIDYVRKDKVNTEDKFKELKKIVEQSLSNMEQVDAVLSSYLEHTTMEEEVERTEKRHSTSRFEIYKTSQKLYNTIEMEDDGALVINHRSRSMNIKDIIKIKTDMATMTLDKMMKKWKDKFNPNHFHRVVFNIEQGTFDDFIERFKSKKDALFSVKPYHQKTFVITGFNDDETFILGNGVKSQFTIIDVIRIKNKVIDKNITSERAKVIASEFDFTYGIFERIVYSLQKGVFDYYIDNWKNKVNNIGNPKKTEPIIQNNREKRIEIGLGGVIPSS